MPQPTIYHNPRCSKSREALKLLETEGFEPKIIEYLKEPLSQSELEKLLKKLKLNTLDIMRTKEAEFKTLKLNAPNVTEKKLLKALAEHPKLLERPIVVFKNKAAIGRPPEAILEILD